MLIAQESWGENALEIYHTMRILWYYLPAAVKAHFMILVMDLK